MRLDENICFGTVNAGSFICQSEGVWHVSLVVVGTNSAGVSTEWASKFELRIPLTNFFRQLGKSGHAGNSVQRHVVGTGKP